MDIITGILFAFVVLAGIAWIAKRFVKPAAGEIPRCCGGGSLNRLYKRSGT